MTSWTVVGLVVSVVACASGDGSARASSGGFVTGLGGEGTGAGAGLCTTGTGSGSGCLTGAGGLMVSGSGKVTDGARVGCCVTSST